MNALAKKISLASADIGIVEKDATNNFHKYNYQSWESVLVAVKAACVKHGIVIVPGVAESQCISIKTKSGEVPSLSVLHRFTVIDTDSGDSLTADWYGQANLDDDKAFNKAGTAAYKYFVLKLFQITVKGDDSDTDVYTRNQEPSACGLPLNEKQEAKARTECESSGIKWETFVEVCQRESATTPAKVREILSGLKEQAVSV